MEENRKYIFEKLTPVNNCDMNVYTAALDFVFKENDVKNVAISGSYGAGKSSMLAAYKVRHKNIKFLHVSLAHFQDSPDSSCHDNPSYIKESVLEGKILNQLIHQIPYEEIPQTNFKVKKSTGNLSIMIQVMLVLVFFTAFIHILFFVSWTNLVDRLSDSAVKNILNISTNNFSLIISGILCLGIVGYFLYQLLVLQKNKSVFKKLNFQGNEIEIFEDSNDSFFDKYLNEVLYLFENVDADVIVFEDMDRFDANKIFERLREINTLSNIQRAKDGKKCLRFFYLLRDDIFTSKDRTKFFDYIIPVVPVVDSSNSYNQLISHLSKNNLLSKFDNRFLQGISLYVDDMRLLKNICNEFLIYYNRLNTTELDYNKMFALITYKNLFPQDYNDLQFNKGFVFALFENKNKFIKEKTDELLNLIQNKKERIANGKQEISKSEYELMLIFNYKKNRYTNKLSADDQSEYDRRLQAVRDQNEDVIKKLEREISQHEDGLKKAENMRLSSIITRENIDHIFSLTVTNEIGEENSFNEIKRNEYFPLIKFLIWNGYIDETYSDYMTYFYENSLSRIDKIYLRSIADKKSKPYNYELKSAEMVFHRLHPMDFDQKETLNFMLLDYLLTEQSSSEHLLHLISQLHNDMNFEFIAKFFDFTSNKRDFIQIFNKHWSGLFAALQKDNIFNQDQLKLFSVYTLYYTDEDTLAAINENNILTKYINNSEDYLSIEKPENNVLISAFKQLKVSFHKINYELSDKNLFKLVYENNLYELNFYNLATILEKIYGINSIEDIRHKNYTIIYRNPETPLYNRIKNNINDYFTILLNECDNKISDSEDAVISILNCKDIESGKGEYLKYLDTPLHNLTDYKDHSIWSQLLDSDTLVCSEANVFTYFIKKQEIDSSLVSFINRADKRLNFSSANIDIAEKERRLLLDHIINCNDIFDDQYQSIVTTLGFQYSTFNIPDISDSKMVILINNNIIEMNPDNLKYIRKNYSNILFKFIKRHIKDYVSIMNKDLFSQEELIEILSLNIKESYKIDLLKFSTNEISIINKNYSLDICMYILKHNLMQDDMRSLYLLYNKQSEEIQIIILQNAADHITEIINDPHIADDALKKDLLDYGVIPLGVRIQLVAAMLPDLEQTEASKYLKNIGLDDFAKIFEPYCKPKFKITDQNKELLDSFKQNKWIYEYFEDENNPGYYKIRRKAQKKS